VADQHIIDLAPGYFLVFEILYRLIKSSHRFSKELPWPPFLGVVEDFVI